MVDCGTSNGGCKGGLVDGAFAYSRNYGLESDSAYPYKAVKRTCAYSAALATNKIAGFKYCSNYGGITACNADVVYNLLTSGPLSVGIDGSVIQSYISGIFTKACSSDNHAVVLAGHGIDTTNGEYWIVRNSWGTTWGENGYIRVKINESNKYSCFVNNEALLPIV